MSDQLTESAEIESGEVSDPDNPYVGPRPFRSNEQHLFFGRERDAGSVVNSLLSSRVMLLHSPSGAGKTSIIQISVVPAFRKRDFLVCGSFKPRFSALRVNLPPPKHVAISNRYVFSVANGLVGDFTDEMVTASMTLDQALDRYAEHHQRPGRPQLLIIDQLEEVVTLERGDADGQTEFFRQLGAALDNPHRWGLLAIREEYVGALDRFRQYVPGQLRSMYRLDLLDAKAATRAVRAPADTKGVEFEADAVDLLVNELRLVHSGQVGEEHPTVKHPYVEPVLLQVVCYSLFKKLRKEQGDQFQRITGSDVENFKPLDKSLGKYYKSVLRDVAGRDIELEHLLRHWVEHELIGESRLRRQTRAKPPVQDSDQTLARLQAWYLVRDDPRPGGTELWELAHDMLVGPVLEENRAWRRKNLAPWRVQAEDWWASQQNPVYLLDRASHRTVPHGRRRANFTATEHAFLKASERGIDASAEADRAAAKEKRRWRRMVTAFGFVLGLLVISAVLNLVLLALHFGPG